MEEAQGMIDGWLNKYVGAKKYLEWCAAQVKEGKFLQTPWGNRRRFGLVTKTSLQSIQNEAKNFPIQGSSSHTLLYSAMHMEQYLATNYNAKIINLIHDSILIEVPKDPETVMAVSRYASNAMIETPKKLFNCPIPFACDTDLGPDWGHVEAYNNKTGMMELEDDNHVVTEVPYAEWISRV